MFFLRMCSNLSHQCTTKLKKPDFNSGTSRLRRISSLKLWLIRLIVAFARISYRSHTCEWVHVQSSRVRFEDRCGNCDTSTPPPRNSQQQGRVNEHAEWKWKTLAASQTTLRSYLRPAFNTPSQRHLQYHWGLLPPCQHTHAHALSE